MKASCVLVVSMLAAALPARAQPAPHVRALDPIAGMALERGVNESARFRALLDQLGASDLIVHVVATPALPLGRMGTMRFVARLGDTRYVRIDLASMAPPDLRVATLAHELQHACEVAQSDAGSHDAVRRLYRAIGQAVPGARDAFETDGAQQAAAQVWGELRVARRAARATEH
jgi:hypothetical protein